VTTVSHELRTPLTSIRSFSEIVHDYPDLPVEERREFLQIIVQESERLTRLLNDILDTA
jgi:signal transduction histidine kinase